MPSPYVAVFITYMLIFRHADYFFLSLIFHIIIATIIRFFAAMRRYAAMPPLCCCCRCCHARHAIGACCRLLARAMLPLIHCQRDAVAPRAMLLRCFVAAYDVSGALLDTLRAFSPFSLMRFSPHYLYFTLLRTYIAIYHEQRHHTSTVLLLIRDMPILLPPLCASNHRHHCARYADVVDVAKSAIFMRATMSHAPPCLYDSCLIF